jgi:ribosome-associated protein YbcJ (S4-like RNA binding protein)
MAKGKLEKDRKYNGQRKTRKGQKIQWPKENDKRTDNIMAKGEQQKYKQYNGQRKTTKGQTI